MEYVEKDQEEKKFQNNFISSILKWGDLSLPVSHSPTTYPAQHQNLRNSTMGRSYVLEFVIT